MISAICLTFVGLLMPSLSAEEIHANEEPLMQNFIKVHKPRMMVIGIECRTSNDSNAGPKDIPLLWQKFYAENIQSKIPNKASDEVIALYCDYEGDYTQPYSCVIGCIVNSLEQIPEGMVGKVVPESTFALYHTEGDFPKNLIDTWGHIWHSDLKRTYAGDYEVYGHKFSGPSKEVDVLVAIEK
ncbi:MAG: effector binding domain-containing protein [Verrucomicrobia bacterium]|nr:effector binding domain-containing protein [Verrucomicrobiota bacterium]